MTVAAVTLPGHGREVRAQGRPPAHHARPAAEAGERRSFTVAYRGVPRAGLRIGKNRHGERTFFSEQLARPRRGSGCRRSTTRATRRPASSSSRRPPQLPGRLQRPAGGRDGPRRRPPADALEAVGPDRDVAQCPGRAQFAVAPRRHGQRGPAGDLGLPPGPRAAGPGPRGTPGRRSEFFSEHIGPLPVREARRGPGRRA